MPDYSKGKIYTIRCRNDDTLIYVGSTTQPLSKRWGSHKIDSKKNVNRLIYSTINNEWDNWFVELYEEYPCENKEQLCKREGEVIREIGTLNIQISGRTPQEYYIDNADKLKEYRQANADKIKEKNEKYYQTNADKILEQKKEYYLNNADKRKEYRQANADKIKEKSKEYYQANADKKKEKNKEYHKNNVDKRQEYLQANADKIKEQMKEYRQRKKLEKAIQ